MKFADGADGEEGARAANPKTKAKVAPNGGGLVVDEGAEEEQREGTDKSRRYGLNRRHLAVTEPGDE